MVFLLFIFTFTASIFSYESHDRPVFPRVRPHAPNTVQTPSASELSFFGKINQLIWRIGDRLKERTILYAFKAGMATAILAAPAFFDATRPLFVRFRGEWALISVRSGCYLKTISEDRLSFSWLFHRRLERCVRP